MANGGYMMKDHGTWERYVPDPYPEGEWKGTAFARRVEDGKDWYAFIEENHFEPDTPKLVVEERASGAIIRTVAVDGFRLFPVGGRVIELTGEKRVQDEASLLAEFMHRTFDLKTGRAGERSVPPAFNIVQELNDLKDRVSSLEQRLKGS
jgi:hypothetical protein